MQRPIAVQLYTVRDLLAHDLPGTMEQIARMGYRGVEPFAGLDHATLIPLCRQHDLTVTSLHLPLPLPEKLDEGLDIAAAYGVERVIVPYLPPEQFQSADGIRRAADLINDAASAAQGRGFSLGYHNHEFEFQRVDGRFAYDLLLDHLEAAIFLEVDLYWTQVGGGDPLAVLHTLGERAPLLHIKDGPGMRGQPMLAVGEGIMSYPALIEASSADWLIVELDECATAMLAAVERSYTYLTGQGLASGKAPA
jgi:sugar phosphate isomerase/epimerase